MSRSAFIVIVSHQPGDEPVIGDVLWALLDSRTFNNREGWHLHVANLTADMLAHHGLPEDGAA